MFLSSFRYARCKKLAYDLYDKSYDKYCLRLPFFLEDDFISQGWNSGQIRIYSKERAPLEGKVKEEFSTSKGDSRRIHR